MFSICDLVIINKIDVLPYFDFDLKLCEEYVKMRNPNATIIPISAKTGEGVDKVCEWLRNQVKLWKGSK
jgi:hydrogenase nickel incorporation protein HypB